MTIFEQNNDDSTQEHCESKEDNKKSNDKDDSVFLDTSEIISNAKRSVGEAQDNMMFPRFDTNAYIPDIVQVEPSSNYIENYEFPGKIRKNNSLVYGLTVLMILLLGFIGILYFSKRSPRQVSR